uniref:Uncharacterized protein n=1 Tax=Anguilla anguilla TaxID=7936 RepID=A0A0E9UCH0_ANGAN
MHGVAYYDMCTGEEEIRILTQIALFAKYTGTKQSHVYCLKSVHTYRQ